MKITGRVKQMEMWGKFEIEVDNNTYYGSVSTYEHDFGIEWGSEVPQFYTELDEDDQSDFVFTIVNELV